MSKALSTTNMLMQPGGPQMVEEDVSEQESEGSLLSSTIATAAAAAAMGADGSTTADCRKECDRVSIGDLCVTVYVLHLIYRK